jgi:hypothetical protein
VPQHVVVPCQKGLIWICQGGHDVGQFVEVVLGAVDRADGSV